MANMDAKWLGLSTRSLAVDQKTEFEGFAAQFVATSLGVVPLKGKQEAVELVSVEELG